MCALEDVLVLKEELLLTGMPVAKGVLHCARGI
jgi:hypothetical protein